jgi:UDP-N-acetylglucosamine 3-dehydrogenase
MLHEMESLAEPQEFQLERRLKVGVIGVGAMGRNHARIYSQLPEVQLIAIADMNSELAASVAQSHRCKAYADYNDLLEEHPDAVSIAVPTALHKKVALDAISKKINILIEKPIANRIENADEIIEAARQNGVKLMVGHIERFNPAITKLKELTDSGELGDLISFSAKRVGPYNPRASGIGVIVDIGTHDIDIMSYICGERAREVYSLAGRVVHGYEDHAIIMLKFNNGGSGVIEVNWLTPHKVRKLTVVGSNGIAEVDYIESSLRISDREGERQPKINRKEPLKLELEHFIGCVCEDKEPSVSGVVGRNALEVALAAVESYKTGRVCRIK